MRQSSIRKVPHGASELALHQLSTIPEIFLVSPIGPYIHVFFIFSASYMRICQKKIKSAHEFLKKRCAREPLSRHAIYQHGCPSEMYPTERCPHSMQVDLSGASIMDLHISYAQIYNKIMYLKNSNNKIMCLKNSNRSLGSIHNILNQWIHYLRASFMIFAECSPDTSTHDCGGLHYYLMERQLLTTSYWW